MSLLGNRAVFCPGCLGLYKRDEILHVGDDGQPVSPPPPRRGLRSKRRDQWAARAEAAERDASLRCPRGDALPPETLSRRTFVVGLVGEKQSGKGHYLAAVVDQLQRGALARYGCTVTLTGDSASRYDRIYWQPLFGDKVPVEATPPLRLGEGERAIRPPLMLEISLRTGRTVNVLIYDAAGEQMTTEKDLAVYNKFLFASDAIMLFVTPSVLVPELRDDRSENQQSLQRTTTMVHAVSKQIRSVRTGSADREVEDLHVAVLLSKADQLVRADVLDKELLEDLPWGSLTLAEARSRLYADSTCTAFALERNNGENLLLSLARCFPKASYHAVSATGHDVGEDSRYPEVRPARVLDPLMELFATAGLIEDRR